MAEEVQLRIQTGYEHRAGQGWFVVIRINGAHYGEAGPYQESEAEVAERATAWAKLVREAIAASPIPAS
jgi:hypothetical protein